MLPIQHVGGDEIHVAAARVSSQGIKSLDDLEDKDRRRATKLIDTLMAQRHGSPFEHGYATFYVHAPLFIWEEIKRHRHMPFDHDDFSLSQESARYKEIEPVFWVPARDRKLVVPEGYKAMRPQFTVLESDAEYEDLISMLRSLYLFAHGTYVTLLQRGYAREVARAVLPHGIYASGWVSGNPRALLHFISLRTHEESAKYVSYPQAEIEDMARQIEQFVSDHWPTSYDTFQLHGRVAP